jgi:curved DNA-binding protein
MPVPDYYKTLGVSETASADEIKKAYRKLAKKFHPDVTGGDKSKEARFKEITEAYETVGDKEKRTKYDEMRKNPFAYAQSQSGSGFPGGFPGGMNIDLDELRRQVERERAARRGKGGGRVHFDFGEEPPGQTGPKDSFSDILRDMFAGFGVGGGSAAARAAKEAQQPHDDRGGDMLAKLEVELPEAALGADKAVAIDGKHLRIKIPPGVTTGKTIRLAGQGQPAPGMAGGKPGDLLVEIVERPHPFFRRREPGSPDIEVEMPLPLDVAVLGGKADVRTLEGTTLKLTVPPGTSSGKKLRLRGKGAHKDKTERGDLYAVTSIQVPSEVPDKAKELISEFAKLTKK